MKNSFRKVLVACAAVTLGSYSATAQFLIIDLPEVTLQANTPGQTFDIFVQNTGASRSDITGIQFSLQTADGGPSAGGVIPAPSITDVDLTTGALFSSNNGYNDGLSTAQVFIRGTLTSSGTVTIPNGSPFKKIATVTIDTSGFFSGAYSMTLNTLNGPTRFTSTGGNVFPTLIDGSITVVPEMNGSAAIGGLLLAFAAALRWRRVVVN